MNAGNACTSPSIHQSPRRREDPKKSHNSFNPQSPQTNHVYQCSITQQLSSILDDSDSLLLFDKARVNVRENDKNHLFIENYEKELAKVQLKVLSKYNEMSEQFKRWEHDFLLKNLREPATDDMMKTSKKELFKKMQLAKKYFKHWKMDV